MLKITAPTPITAEVAGVAFARGVALVDPETIKPGSLAYFRRRRYQVEDQDPAPADTEPAPGPEAGAYDPKAADNFQDVLAYLARGDVDEAEAVRVLDAEAAGKARVSITKHRAEILAAKRQAVADDDTTPEATA
jgi:hypothetical protein